MSGDLSLSQSLGGLRIANPDQDTNSPTVSPSETKLSTSNPLSPSSTNIPLAPDNFGRPDLLTSLSHDTTTQSSTSGDFGFDPSTYALHDVVSPTTSSRKPSDASPASPYAQRALKHRLSAQLQRSSPATNSVPGARYLNDMYMQPNISATSQHSSYRYRDDSSSELNSTGLTRNGSRSTRNVLGDTQEPGRLYRQGGAGLSESVPQRRPSQRSRATTQDSTQGYEARPSSYMGVSSTQPEGRSTQSGTRSDTDAPRQLNARGGVKKGVKDFTFGRTLGEGSYSTVTAATDRQTLKEYAIKVLDKRHIIKEKKVKYVNIERDTLNRLTEHPGVVRLYYTFQDERSLYFVLDLASGGELLGVLKKLGSFDVECTQFYGAQILDAIAYMHSRGVIHRDLKPENVLLDRDMHVKITDFGTAKILSEPRPQARGTMDAAGDPLDGAETDRAMSFVGTAEYVSPELLRDKNACKASDLWAFGCIIFQLLAGRPPFKAANEYLTFQKILALDYKFPTGFPEPARDLVERLLVLEPANRLPVEHIKTHRFFDGIQWGRGLWRQKAPRLKPYVAPLSQPQPIRLNGPSLRKGDLSASAAATAMSNSPSQPLPAPSRPQLRGVTELPPPSQLDIDWSPVLTHNNERILKLGNLTVSVSPQGQVPLGEPGTPPEKSKISRFFSSATTKKRERLVLITSSARLLIAPAGGNEKRAKMDLNCLASDASWKSYVDSKGLTAWYLDTREKHILFEDPRATTSDPAGSKYSTQEWLDSLEQARELAIAGNSLATSYSGDSMLYSSLEPTLSSPSESMRGDVAGIEANQRHNLRHTLRRNTDDDSFKGRKRFSKRHSKSGLAAVF